MIAPLAVAVAGCSSPAEPRKAYVGLFGDNAVDGTVTAIDLAAARVVKTFPVGAGPRKIAIQP